jgi:peptidyl-prolyl cis-trans isomerase A (cyclophilin A)
LTELAQWQELTYESGSMKRRLALTALILLPAVCLCQDATDKSFTAEKGSTSEPTSKSQKVRMKTNLGDIVIQLNGEKAPISTANFLSYVKKKHYDGTVFHRVIDDFMIQGGGFTVDSGNLVQKSVDAPIQNEGQNGLKNDRGTIAMARTSNPHSATAQFFINVSDNAGLNYPSNGGYAVFGKVIEGMDVVDKIKAVETTNTGSHQNVPVKPVVVQSATVIE